MINKHVWGHEKGFHKWIHLAQQQPILEKFDCKPQDLHYTIFSNTNKAQYNFSHSES